MYETVIFNKEAQVIHRSKDGIKVVCRVPSFYTNDTEIANLISKLLEENSKKYKLEFEM